MQKIEIGAADGSAVAVKPLAYLGGEFAAFRGACASGGARYDAARRANLAPVESVPRLVAALRDAGFEPVLTPDVAARLQAVAAQRAEQGVAADARISATDAALAARGLALFPFQRAGVRWLSERASAALFDEQGLGKTMQTIVSAHDGQRAIVVAPAVAKGVWSREVAKWRPEFRTAMLSGRGSFRAPAQDGEWVVTNYDILPTEEEVAALRFEGNTLLIADEAHLLKGGRRSQRGQRFLALSRAVRAAGGRVLVLTGTPQLNRNPGELYTVLEMAGLAQEAFGSWSHYRDLWNAQDGRFGIIWGAPSPEVGRCLQRVSLRRRRTEVLPDLPTKMYEQQSVDLDGAAGRRAQAALDRIQESLRQRGIDLSDVRDRVRATSALAAAFEELSAARREIAVAKIPAMLDIVQDMEDAEEPVVVFSAHREPIDALAQRPGWAVVTGDTAPADRTRIEDAFQRGELRGVALTIQAGGVAITLTRAHRMVFVDLAWTTALNDQAEDRCCRIGQTRGVVVTRLALDHEVERRVIDLLTEKQSLIDGSVNRSVTETAHASVSDELRRTLAAVVVATIEPVRLRRHADTDAERAIVEAVRRAPRRGEFIISMLSQYDNGDGWTPRQWEAAGRVAADVVADEKRRAEQERAQERVRKQSPEERRREREQQARERARARAAKIVAETPVRGPVSEQERWAAAALTYLNDNNADCATIQNGVGFNKPDSGRGQQFAFQVQFGGLDDAGWAEAVRMCRKYHGQVGACPAPAAEQAPTQAIPNVEAPKA